MSKIRQFYIEYFKGKTEFNPATETPMTTVKISSSSSFRLFEIKTATDKNVK